MSFELFLFYGFAFLAVFSSVAMVALVRHVVAGVMSLLVTMVSLAGIYVLLHAELIAVIQIMVYGGAILVLFLFVIMLLNLREGGFPEPPEGQNVLKIIGVGGSVGVGVLLVVNIAGDFTIAPFVAALPQGFGGYRAIGLSLYSEYVVPLELVGLILLAAIIGAVILAKRRID